MSIIKFQCLNFSRNNCKKRKILDRISYAYMTKLFVRIEMVALKYLTLIIN